MHARVTYPIVLDVMDLSVIVRGTIHSTSPTDKDERFCVHLELVTGMSTELDRVVTEFIQPAAGETMERHGLTVTVHFVSHSFEAAERVLLHRAADLAHLVVSMARLRNEWFKQP